MNDDAVILEMLRNSRTIAVVGLSGKRLRPSHGVSAYMQRQGYRIVPVNPAETEVLGEKAYAALQVVPETIDMVNVFRTSDAVPGIVDEVIAKGAKYLWLQEGVVHEAAAEKARAAGIKVVMDRCVLKEHQRLML